MWMGKSLLHFGWQFRNSPQSKSSDWRGDRVRYLPNEASCWKWFDWEWCWEGRGGQHRWFWARFGVISGQQRGKASPQEVQVEFFLFFDNFVNLISREFLVNLCNTGSFWASNGAKAWFQSQVDFFYKNTIGNSFSEHDTKNDNLKNSKFAKWFDNGQCVNDKWFWRKRNSHSLSCHGFHEKFKHWKLLSASSWKFI